MYGIVVNGWKMKGSIGRDNLQKGLEGRSGKYSPVLKPFDLVRRSAPLQFFDPSLELAQKERDLCCFCRPSKKNVPTSEFAQNIRSVPVPQSSSRVAPCHAKL